MFKDVLYIYIRKQLVLSAILSTLALTVRSEETKMMVIGILSSKMPKSCMLDHSHPDQATQHCLKFSHYNLWSAKVWDHGVNVFTKYT